MACAVGRAYDARHSRSGRIKLSLFSYVVTRQNRSGCLNPFLLITAAKIYETRVKNTSFFSGSPYRGSAAEKALEREREVWCQS